MNNKATIFNGYEYNEHGVCVNPEVAYEWGNRMVCYFKISISETPQGWVCGSDYCGKTYGGGGGCFLDDKYNYSSRSRAIVACAETIKRQFSRDKNATKAITALDRIISEESEKKKPQIKQLSIFDYL